MKKIPMLHNFEEITIGDTEKFTEKIHENLLDAFSTISGDYNPLHMDENYAKQSKFQGRVCHGMLLASFFSKLVGMYMPGKNALYFSQTLNFLSPCFVNDEIVIQGQVIDKSYSTKMITLKTTISNQHGKCIVDGIAKVIVRDK